MSGRLRRCWPVVKALVGLAIVAALAVRFSGDLGRPELWQRPWRPGWLALSGALYLAGLSLSALYWQRLLGHLGHRLPLALALQACYVGHLGKYLPGKAWALLLRAGLVRPAGIPLGMATLTAFYEVLTTMAAGALLAASLFALMGEGAGEAPTLGALRQLARLEVPAEGVGRDLAVTMALLLFAACAAPLLPALFNRVARRLPGRSPGAPVPRIGLLHLGEGLALTAVGWLLLGAALAAALAAVGVAPTSPAALGRLTAGLAVAYVAGFVVLVAPGGVGVREFFLALFLVPELVGAGVEPGEARGLALLTALLLRLTWTAAEVLVAGAIWARRSFNSSTIEEGRSATSSYEEGRSATSSYEAGGPP